MATRDSHDPHDIVPDGFCEAYGEDTIPAALEAAERAGSTSSYDEMIRCPGPGCGSVRIRTKRDEYQVDHKRPQSYQCTMCRAHFDDPAPPVSESNTDTTDR